MTAAVTMGMGLAIVRAESSARPLIIQGRGSLNGGPFLYVPPMNIKHSCLSWNCTYETQSIIGEEGAPVVPHNAPVRIQCYGWESHRVAHQLFTFQFVNCPEPIAPFLGFVGIAGRVSQRA